MTRFVLKISALAAAASLGVACGKKGNPLPPLHPVPTAAAGFSVERMGDQVTLRFTVPDGNLDGTTPPKVTAVEVYGVTQPEAAPAPAPRELATAAYRIGTIEVRRADQTTPANATDKRPAPGDAASFAEKLSVPSGTTVRYYAVAGLVGNRRGPASPVLALPLGEPPDPPADLKVDYTEQAWRLSWTSAALQRVIVEEIVAADAPPKRLTPEALTAAEFSMPIEFGRERCFTVRSVISTPAVLSVGPASARQCQTPVDRFAPPAPTELQAFAGEGAVDLIWTASTAPDVAGYIVLRGEGADGTLTRLTTTPVTATQYRDAGVRAGGTYSYQVIAIDRTTPPNESGPSNRLVVTARQP